MKRLLIAACSLLALTACETLKSMDEQNKTATTKPGKATASKNSSKSSAPVGMFNDPKSGSTIKIVTSPADANCAVDVDNMTMERVNGTPASFKAQRTGKDLVIRCLKSGYKQETYVAKANPDKGYQHTVELKLKKK